jgi:hypothetical protein
MLDHPFGELLPGIVGRVLCQQPAEQGALREMAKPIENSSCARNER